MVAPNAEIEGKGVVLISSEEGETECNNENFLKDFGLMDGAILKCDDFLQDYNITVILYHRPLSAPQDRQRCWVIIFFLITVYGLCFKCYF